VDSITVAICTYDKPGFLRQALASLEAQRVSTGCRWQVLVVDNNSMPATEPVVSEFMERGEISGLRLVSETRQGLSHARRRAILESDTELVAFVDDDCVLDPDWVERAVTFLTSRPGAGAVGGRVSLSWHEPPPPVVAMHATSYARQDHGDAPLQAPAGGLSCLVGAGLVVRRQAVMDSGWLERFHLSDRTGHGTSSGGDSELVLRIQHAGFQVWYTPELHLRHCIPPERATIPYLCRLHRGFGESHPALWTIARSSIPARAAAPPLFLAYGTLHLLLQGARMGVARIRGRQDQYASARVAFHRHLGQAAAAIRLFRGDHVRL
jgi:glycosyltransferase involved in cell wall biosynthesis